MSWCAPRTWWSLLLFVLVVLPVAAPGGATGHAALAPPGPGDLLLARVAPALSPGAADLIDLVAVHAVSLAGVSLSDGEGELVLGDLWLRSGQVLRLVSDAEVAVGGPWGVAPAEALQPAANLAWGDDNETLQATGRFALAKGGDSLTLRLGDVVLDAFVYGDAVLADDAPDAVAAWSGDGTERSRIDGRVYQRSWNPQGWTDTDAAPDWSHPRVYRQAQVDRPMQQFSADRLRAFVCPDHCHDEVMDRVSAAQVSIDLNMYDLSLKEAVEALAAASERGVQVRVLLEERPVAASSDKLDRIAWSVTTMQAAGVDVRVHEGQRFVYDHAKYLVVDDQWTVVLSENANLHGWSPSNRDGNRGWGLAVQDDALAGWFTELFEDDAYHPSDAATYDVAERLPARSAPTWGGLGAVRQARLDVLDLEGPVFVTPVLAPDHLGVPDANPIVQAVTNAQANVRLQQLNLPLDWSRSGYTAPSPIAAALLERIDAGVPVTGTLASAFEDGDVFTDGNDRTAAVLSDAGPSADVRLGGAPDPGAIVHNKGWVVDVGDGLRNAVVVGSANGNLASQVMNREVDLLVEDARVAAYFAGVLDEDMAAAGLPASRLDGAVPEQPFGAIPGPAIGVQLVLVALCLFLVRRRR